MDLYLKFPDESTANSLLFTDEQPNYRNIDIIGTISEGGQWDEEGNEIVAPTVLEGWHVNVRLAEGEDGEILEQFAVYPQTPSRVWG